MGFRSSDKPLCIFVVDDELFICKALRQSLTEHSYLVRTFCRAQECLEALRGADCDLLITDVSMPEMDGIELLRETKKIKPYLPVLLITGYGEIPIAVKAVKAGAFDFIEKPLDEETLLPIVQAALKQNPSAFSPEGQPLTKSEQRILSLIVDGNGNKEIAHILGCSTRTVENHRYRMMCKLKVNSTASLVRTALTAGLVGK
jgi:two-component system, LuxR family, response regulator FixJ